MSEEAVGMFWNTNIVDISRVSTWFRSHGDCQKTHS